MRNQGSRAGRWCRSGAARTPQPLPEPFDRGRLAPVGVGGHSQAGVQADKLPAFAPTRAHLRRDGRRTPAAFRRPPRPCRARSPTPPAPRSCSAPSSSGDRPAARAVGERVAKSANGRGRPGRSPLDFLVAIVGRRPPKSDRQNAASASSSFRAQSGRQMPWRKTNQRTTSDRDDRQQGRGRSTSGRSRRPRQLHSGGAVGSRRIVAVTIAVAILVTGSPAIARLCRSPIAFDLSVVAPLILAALSLRPLPSWPPFAFPPSPPSGLPLLPDRLAAGLALAARAVFGVCLSSPFAAGPTFALAGVVRPFGA